MSFVVRQLINDYAYVSFYNELVREAVRLWRDDRASALQRYGNSNNWDVSKVIDMSSLFRFTSFNDSIDRWDVRNVTSMKEMFRGASRFHQSPSTWDVGRVTNMEGMFYSSLSLNQSLASWNVRQVKLFVGASSFNQ